MTVAHELHVLGPLASDLDRYRDAPLVQSLLDSVAARLPLSATDVAEAVCVLLGLLDAEPDLKGVLPALEPLATVVCELLPSQPPPLMPAVARALAQALGQHPEAGRFARRLPRRAGWPIALLVGAWEASKASTPPYVLFRLWGARLFQRLRQLKQRQGVLKFDDQTFDNYCESVSLLFRLFPHARLGDLVQPSPATWEAHLDLFREAYLDARASSSRMAEIHIRRLKRLWRGLDVRQHRHKAPRPQSELIDDGLDAPITVTALPRRVGDDPEPGIVEEWLDLPGEPVVPNPPRLAYRLAHRYEMASFPAWFGATSLTPRTLERLYELANRLFARGAPEATGFALYLLLLPLTGRPPERLAATTFTPYDPRPSCRLRRDDLYFDPERLCFVAHARELAEGPAPHGDDFWRPSTPWVAFPVPPFLGSLMRQYVAQLHAQSPYLFRPLAAEGPGMLQPLLAAVGLPSPAQLARAFAPLLEHGFGLDRVSAALVSGRGGLRTRVQVHYTRVALADLWRRYARTTRALHDRVRERLPTGGWWDHTSEDDEPHDLESIALGSPRVPQEFAFVELVMALGDRVRQTRGCLDRESLIAHHNAYTAYAYLALLCLGLRPQARPELLRAPFADEVRWLPVADKLSRRYVESRLVPLPSVMRTLLQRLARGVDRLKRRLLQLAGPAAVAGIPDTLLFFLDDQGHPVAFSARRFRTELETAGFPARGALNLGRHLRRSELTGGFADDLIDALLGHQRFGREPLGLHATTRYRSALELLEDLLAVALEQCGIRALPYCQ